MQHPSYTQTPHIIAFEAYYLGNLLCLCEQWTATDQGVNCYQT